MNDDQPADALPPTGPDNVAHPHPDTRPDTRPDSADGPRSPDPGGRPYHVVHVERAFSAQPTLGNALGPLAVVHELPLAEVLAGDLDPDLIWASDATPDLVHLLHGHFPGANLLATLPRDARNAGSRAVLDLLAEGADLVLRDEGILLAAAALQAMARRRGPSAPAPVKPPQSAALTGG